MAVVAWILTLTFPWGALGQEPGGAPPGAVVPVQVSALQGVRVAVDPRIELMAVVQLLAGYPVLTSLEMPYRTDARAYFEGLAADSAVVAFDSMSSAGFAFDAVPKAFMAMSDLPELALGEDLPAEVVARAGGSEALARFTHLLRRFVAESDFGSFYRAHLGTYQLLVDSTRSAAASAVTQLEAYTGAELSDARVVVSPLLHDGGFAMIGGHPKAQVFIGPVAVTNGYPDFGAYDRLGPLIWHEFAHTIVNPLTHRARAAVDSLEVTDEIFRTAMRRQAYTDWETIVNESIIRAIEVRLSTRVLGAEAGARAEALQVKRGFIHVPPLAALLKEYEEDRDAFPTLSSFYPTLLDAFRSAPGTPPPGAAR